MDCGQNLNKRPIQTRQIYRTRTCFMHVLVREDEDKIDIGCVSDMCTRKLFCFEVLAVRHIYAKITNHFVGRIQLIPGRNFAISAEQRMNFRGDFFFLPPAGISFFLSVFFFRNYYQIIAPSPSLPRRPSESPPRIPRSKKAGKDRRWKRQTRCDREDKLRINTRQ